MLAIGKGEGERETENKQCLPRGEEMERLGGCRRDQLHNMGQESRCVGPSRLSQIPHTAGWIQPWAICCISLV